MGVFFALLSALFFATNNVIIKKGSRGSKSNNGYFITVIMNSIILGIIFLITLLFRQTEFTIHWPAIPYFILAGLCTTGLGRMTLYSSILRIGPSQASAIRNSTPIFTTLFAIVVLHETISFVPGIGMLLLVGGMLIAGYGFMREQTRSGAIEGAQSGADKQIWFGYGFAIFSSIIFGVGQGIRKQGLLEMNDAFFGAWIGALTSLVFIIISQLFRRKLIQTTKSIKEEFNVDFLIAGTLTSMGPLLFFLAAMNMQVSYVSAIAASEPLITTVVSALIIKNTEKITPVTWVTVGMIFIGTTIMALYTT